MPDPSGFTPDVEGFTPDPVSDPGFGSLSGVNFDTPRPELSWYDPDYLIPMALRTAPAIAGGILGGTAGSIVPFAGTMAGTAVGGAGGSFLGENLAQGYEMLRGVREHYNPYSVAVNTGLGAIPSMGKAPGLGATAKELTRYAVKAPVMGAVEGGVLGGVGSIPQEWAETGGLPSLGQVGKSAAVGAGFGAVTGGALGSYPSLRKASGMREVAPIHDPTIPMDLPLNTQLPPQFANEFGPVDTPTAAPAPVVHPPAPTVVKAPVNPLRPEVPRGQLTNRDMADALTTRAAQEAVPPVPEAPPIPHEFAPVEPTADTTPSPESTVPQKPGQSDFLDTMDEASLQDFIDRQSKNANYTGTEQGQKLLAYAQHLLDQKIANPPVPINKELPKEPPATNMTPENVADIEAWHRYYRMFKEGKIPDDPTHPLMIEWANVHNRVKDLKPNGSVTIQPHRFDTGPVEPPEYTNYRFPDGRILRLKTDLTKGAETTTFGTKEGEVTLTRVDDLDPNTPFDPNSGFAIPASASEEVQFVDPNTGEIKPASQAKPGDVLLPRGESNTGQSSVPPVKPPRHSSRFGMAGVEQGQGGGRTPPPQNPPFDTSGYVPPEGTPPVRDPNMWNMRQPEIPGTSIPQPAQIPGNYQRPLDVGQMPPVRQPELPGTQQAQPRFDTGAPPQPLPKGLKQPTFEGIEPQRPKGWVTEDKLRPNIPVKRRKPGKSHEQSLLGKIWDTPRSLQSIDAPGITSAALRQSRPLMFTADWFRAWGTAARSFRNKNDVYTAMQDAIKENKYFKPQYEAQYNKDGRLTHYIEKPSIAERAGLLMSDVLNNREDAIRSSLAEQIPGYGRYVKASNRAYTSFLNHLRVTKFEQLMEAAILQGRGNDDVLARKIADYVNSATGRGRLKFGSGKYSVDLEPLADELGHALYSPRALAARLAFMNPSNYVTADPLVRKEYWKSLARMVLSWGAFAGLGKLAGGEVTTDFSSSDAGKVKFGNTRYDPGAGWLQLMHLVGKEYYGGSTSTTAMEKGKPKFTPFGDNPVSGDMWTPLQRYLKNQMNPMTGYVVDLLTAARGGKEPFDVTDRTLQLVAPMFIDDMMRAAQEDSTVQDIFSGILGSAGIGGQTYDKGDFGKPTLTPTIEDLTGFELPTATLGGKRR